MRLYHGTILSSAEDILRNGINLNASQKYLDFGRGFYTTPSYYYAKKTSINKARSASFIYRKRETACVVYMDCHFNNRLNIKQFPHRSIEWARFVINNRLYDETIRDNNIAIHNRNLNLDIVYGEIADKDVVKIAEQINCGERNIDDFKIDDIIRPDGSVYGMQYSFHTYDALNCISLLKYEVIE